MASAIRPPFLVAPKERMSTPRFQVISAGLQPSDTSALTKRAPSMWKAMPCSRQTCAEGFDLVEPVDHAALAHLRDRERLRRHLLYGLGQAAQIGVDVLGLQLGADSGQPGELCPMHEEFRRAALVVDDVGFPVADAEPVGRHGGGESERIGRRPGRDEEDGDLAFEDLVEARLDPLRDLVVAVGGHGPRIGVEDGLENGGAGPRRCCRSRNSCPVS